MKMMFNAFLKKLFGAKYERLIQTPVLCLIVYLGLDLAGFQVQAAPFIFYLMVSVSTATVMWQALSSKDHTAVMQNLMMLPFEEREFVVSYTAALGIYTIITKTAVLLAVLLAVSDWNRTQVLCGILCAVHAVGTTAAVYARRSYWYALIPAVIFLFSDTPWFLPILLAGCAFAFRLLYDADAYSFYCKNGEHSRTVKSHRHGFVWIYFFRYLKSHKNYLTNTVCMWGIACLLPLFFRQTDTLFAVPVGFAVLSLNTPVCILLSCDPALERAVRFLPYQKKLFFMPYCLFIFLCNITANVIFVCSLLIQLRGISIPLCFLAAALFFALLGAFCSVLLEWFYPVHGWKIESDLWHHPRKYLVPAMLLFFAAAIGTMPDAILFSLAALLAVCFALLLTD